MFEPASDIAVRGSGDVALVRYRTEITGEAAGHIGPELGPQITADFPEVLAALAKLAEG